MKTVFVKFHLTPEFGGHAVNVYNKVDIDTDDMEIMKYVASKIKLPNLLEESKTLEVYTGFNSDFTKMLVIPLAHVAYFEVGVIE